MFPQITLHTEASQSQKNKHCISVLKESGSWSMKIDRHRKLMAFQTPKQWAGENFGLLL